MTTKQTAAATLDLLMSVTGMLDGDVSAALAKRGVTMSRSSVQNKRSGGSLQFEDIDSFITLWDVPRVLFAMDAEDVWNWIGDNRPEWVREFAATTGAGRRRRVRSRCDAEGGRRVHPELPFPDTYSAISMLARPDTVIEVHDDGTADVYAMASGL
jgi:hypothetical protein